MYSNANGKVSMVSRPGLVAIGGNKSNVGTEIKRASMVGRKARVESDPALSGRQQPSRAVSMVPKKDAPHWL